MVELIKAKECKKLISRGAFEKWTEQECLKVLDVVISLLKETDVRRLHAVTLLWHLKKMRSQQWIEMELSKREPTRGG